MHRWQDRFLTDVFFPTLDAHQITTVLHGGDYGDRRKYASFATTQFIETRYRARLRERGIHEHVLVGNHDCFLRDSTEINSIEELYRHDDSLTIYAQPTEIDVDGCGVLMMPWLCGNTRERSMELLRTSSCPVVLGHFEIEGFQMYRGMPSHEGLSPDLFDRFALAMSGHYHHASQRDPIRYLGAMWPMVWSDYRDARGFHLLNTETYELTFIENPYSPLARLVYDDEHADASFLDALLSSIVADDSPYRDAYVKVVVKSRTQPFAFEQVLDALTKVNPQDIVVIDDVSFDGSDLADAEAVTTDVDTVALIREYVEHSTVSCDKMSLLTYLEELYREAVSSTQSGRIS
jgi:hypothetical protein